VNSSGGGLITVTEPCPGGLDIVPEVRVVTQSGRIAGWLVTSSPWNQDEYYDTVLNIEKGSYDIVG
jgi:hypothetical protein